MVALPPRIFTPPRTMAVMADTFERSADVTSSATMKPA